MLLHSGPQRKHDLRCFQQSEPSLGVVLSDLTPNTWWYSLTKMTSLLQIYRPVCSHGTDVTENLPLITKEVERYLLTGESDPIYSAWSGNIFERGKSAHDDLRGALVQEIRRRTEGLVQEPLPDTDTVALTRAKVEPMVRGLFPRAEQVAVLARLEQSVVFTTSANIEEILHACSFDSTAWTLANLYLTSFGAELLGKDAPCLVGLSEETTCYVSPEYFAENAPFADFIVHEVAHIFHNCKRVTIGLRETRTKEWLLEIEYRKRETFAYACEAYACVLRGGKRPSERRALAEEYSRLVSISEERVDPAEVADIVREAAAASNGWKVILARCSPTRRPTAHSGAV